MSPSRLMAIMDPLLNTGFLWRCLAAYAGIRSDNDERPHDELENPLATVSNKIESSSENQHTSLPGQNISQTDSVVKHEQIPKSSEYTRGDTYYLQLGRFI